MGSLQAFITLAQSGQAEGPLLPEPSHPQRAPSPCRLLLIEMSPLGWVQSSEICNEVSIGSVNRAEPIYLAWVVGNTLIKSASLA